MSDILDLSVFVGPPRKVRFTSSGPVYLLPRDVPVELMLEILDFQQRADELDDEQVARTLRDDLLELFQVHQPDMTRLPAAVSVPLLVQMFGEIYRADEPAAEEDPTPAAPAAPPGRSTRSSTRPRKTTAASRSSKSSAS